MFPGKGKILAFCPALPSQQAYPRGVSARGFVRKHRTGRWKLPRMSEFMWHLAAPRSAVFACDSVSLGGWVYGNGGVPFRRESAMHALRLTAPQPWLPVGTVFHRAGRTGVNPADVTRRQTRSLCVPHRHARRIYQEKRQARPGAPVVSPGSPEGDHFPQALPVKVHVLPAPKAPIPPDCHAWQRILRRDERIVGMDLRGGENVGTFF
ncbi:hypothetical protein BSY16_3348 [Sinorhizobium sp. RAC02]|nr:hypothetical protein BSY16_3348 [Sinorhizobium sp. RAC02]